jgi:penicillin-binding protein 2
MMYGRRIKIMTAAGAGLLLVCLLRLADMQLLSDSFYREQIANLKLQGGASRQSQTVRGRILDRNGLVLAVDEPRFWLCISYRLSCLQDRRVQKAMLLRVENRPDAETKLPALQQELAASVADLNGIIEKCTRFGTSREDIESQIAAINDRIWNLRMFFAWARNNPSPAILEKYNNDLNMVPLSEAIADFERNFPDEDRRFVLIDKVDNLADMDKSRQLLELKTDDDIFAAQVEFLDVNGIEISVKPHRVYPFGSVAAQTIGWVGPAQKRDRELLVDDKLASYAGDEVCGREDGAEYVCEKILRGRRGEIVYDIDRQLVSRTERQFGQDVSLTIDVKLQERIESYFRDCSYNPNCSAPTAAVVIDVATGDILVLVSLPAFDLNLIRQTYGVLANDPNEPMRNRALNEHYHPGSVVKPLILVAGLESGRITADEVISCPAAKAPSGWPSCWIYNRYNWMGHDNQGRNNARNAIKGSCNIYFSRLADRIDALTLQQWLFAFGYGRKIPLAPTDGNDAEAERDFREARGQISDTPAKTEVTSFEQVPPLSDGERRWFGIGHGNMRATPLQVANAMAILARGGINKPPRLIITDANEDARTPAALNISQQTLSVVHDGMWAVVNEPSGTAYSEFQHSGLARQGVKVYGKTGSTEKPDNAWFAGFAKDNPGKGIAVAVIVEGGQHGASDAGPLAREIIQFCIEAGCLGQAAQSAR